MAAERHITQADIEDLIQAMNEAAGAIIRGDLRGYMAQFDHASDYTLMPPYGGETGRGFEYTEERAAWTRTFFTSGEATLEVEQTYSSGDLVVLVAVERQHGVAGGLPDQDLSLRVTLVFRRVEDRWQLVHRHADPLVRQIPHEHLAELARGLGT